jgi:hypothetical protein
MAHLAGISAQRQKDKSKRLETALADQRAGNTLRVSSMVEPLLLPMATGISCADHVQCKKLHWLAAVRQDRHKALIKNGFSTERGWGPYDKEKPGN